MAEKIDYSDDGTCKNCNLKYTYMDKLIRDRNGVEHKRTTAKCACALHIIVGSNMIVSRKLDGTCHRCHQKTYFAIKSMEYKIKFCACGCFLTTDNIHWQEFRFGVPIFEAVKKLEETM